MIGEQLAVGIACGLIGLMGGWAGSASYLCFKINGRVSAVEAKVDSIESNVETIRSTVASVNDTLRNLCGRLGV